MLFCIWRTFREWWYWTVWKLPRHVEWTEMAPVEAGYWESTKRYTGTKTWCGEGEEEGMATLATCLWRGLGCCVGALSLWPGPGVLWISVVSQRWPWESECCGWAKRRSHWRWDDWNPDLLWLGALISEWKLQGEVSFTPKPWEASAIEAAVGLCRTYGKTP